MERYQLKCCAAEPGYRVYYGSGYTERMQDTAHLHYDGSLTLTFFMQCSGMIQIEGNSYRLSDGDVVIMNTREIHNRKIDENTYLELITIHVNEDLLRIFPYEAAEVLDPFYKRRAGEGNLISAEMVTRHGLDRLAKNIYEAAGTESAAGKILTVCRLTELLICLSKMFLPAQAEIGSASTESRLIRDVLRYINDHFCEEVNCLQIADQFYLSKYRLEHLFKETVGVPLWEYVILKRLIRFHDLLRDNPALSVLEAAWLAGFRNYTNFYRLYKKHMNQTPAEFKKTLTGREK